MEEERQDIGETNTSRQLLCGFDFIPSSHQESIKMPAVC